MLCTRDNCDSCTLQYGRLFQWPCSIIMGYDTGLNTDLTCPFAPCFLYVHTAACKPYKHRLSSTNCYSIWYYLEYMFLLPPTKETQCGISSNLCLFIYIVFKNTFFSLVFQDTNVYHNGKRGNI